MRLLSRKEEMILLAIWKLQDNAYGVTVREYLERMAGVKWLFGAIYSPLGRLMDGDTLNRTRVNLYPNVAADEKHCTV